MNECMNELDLAFSARYTIHKSLYPDWQGIVRFNNFINTLFVFLVFRSPAQYFLPASSVFGSRFLLLQFYFLVILLIYCLISSR